MLRLVTISRISKEKGFARMVQMEGLLAAAGISFIWDCYGDTNTSYAQQIAPDFKHVNFKGITTEPLEVVKQYDYLVQLSDTEGFPYSIYEAMQQKVPVIATNFPSIHEMITDGVSGYILKSDLSNLDPAKLLEIPKIKTFKEKSNTNDWLKIITMKTPRAAKAPKNTVTLKVTKRYFDTKLKKEMPIGAELKESEARAKELVNAEVAVIV